MFMGARVANVCLGCCCLAEEYLGTLALPILGAQ